MTSTFNWRPLKTEVGSLIELEWSIGSVGLNESFRKSTNCPLGTLSIYFQSKMYVNIYWKRLPQTKHPNSLFSRQVEVSISHRLRFIERLALQAFIYFHGDLHLQVELRETADSVWQNTEHKQESKRFIKNASMINLVKANLSSVQYWALKSNHAKRKICTFHLRMEPKADCRWLRSLTTISQIEACMMKEG